MSKLKSYHQHYHFIKQYANELHAKLQGATLIQALTLSKHELVLVFAQNNQPITLRVIANYQSGFLLLDEQPFQKGSNAQACFVNVLRQEVSAVVQHMYNRSFEIVFSNSFKLLFKCYDALINVVELVDNEVYDVFRESIQNDWVYDSSSFSVVDQSVINALDEIPYTSSNFWMVNQTDSTGLALVLTQPEEFVFHTKSALEASTYFAKHALTNLFFLQQKTSLLASLNGEIKRYKQQIKLSERGIGQLINDSPFEEMGHLIMANLHAIPKRVKSVQVFDFYRNVNITLKLKEELSAADNAAYYYRKAKNKKIELEQMEQKLLGMRTRLAQAEITRAEVLLAKGIRDLKRFKSINKQQQPFPFKKFVLDGFEIWVGKNAQNNDLLTQKFAHKNDLWLHAKDVSGSHTVIKHKAGKPFSNSLIAGAAQIAAYYSKHKGNTLAPVSYTLKKFVRKPKGAEPGSVVIDREEVILVEPRLP